MKKKDIQGANSFYPHIKEYTRILKGRHSFGGGHVTVYGSDTKLAMVSGDGYTEKVSYIEMKNIRAVLIRRYPLKIRVGVLGLVFLFLFGAIYHLNKESPATLVITFLVLALSYALLVLSLKRCSLRIVTDVNEHPVANLSRLSTARMLLAFVVERMQPFLCADAEPVAEKSVPPDLPPVTSEEERV